MRKIFLLLLLTFTTLFGSQMGVVQGLDPFGDGFLSLRVQPKSTEIAKLYNGDEVEILDRSGKYYKVKALKSSEIGWAHSNWIKSISTAVEFYGKACDMGESISCLHLGEIYDNGEDVDQDYAKAVEFYGKGCDVGEGTSCYNLGVKYEKGQGVKQDYAKAAELFGKACDHGGYWGCYRLGFMHEKGIGVQQDYAKAQELFAKARHGEGDVGDEGAEE